MITSVTPIAAAAFALPVINHEITTVSSVPVTRHEIAFARLLLCVSIDFPQGLLMASTTLADTAKTTSSGTDRG